MDKLIDYVCDELDELEKKASKGKLSAAEVQYGDLLAHFKKNLLTADAMEGNYSEDYRGASYARGRHRDSMGRYSSRYSRRYSEAVDNMVDRLRSMMDEAPNEEVRSEIHRLVTKMENM